MYIDTIDTDRCRMEIICGKQYIGIRYRGRTLYVRITRIKNRYRREGKGYIVKLLKNLNPDKKCLSVFVTRISNIVKELCRSYPSSIRQNVNQLLLDNKKQDRRDAYPYNSKQNLISSVSSIAHGAKAPNSCRLTRYEVAKVGAMLALRIDPMIACAMLRNEFGARLSCAKLVQGTVVWSNLCKAWKLHDMFRNDPNDLSKLAAAYKELYSRGRGKGIPDVYLTLAARLLYLCRMCIFFNNTMNTSLLSLCSCIEQVLNSYSKLHEALECINGALRISGYRTRGYYYQYRECGDGY